MARFNLICAAVILLVASPRVRADELKPGELPVSNERMAELIELAASGKLTIPGAMAPEEETAQRQVGFLRQIILARKVESLGGAASADPAVTDFRSGVAANLGDHRVPDNCYRAVMAAHAGDYFAASNLLVEGYLAHYNGYDYSHDYCRSLYQRLNGKTLTYQFLRWWREHVSGWDSSLGILMLMAAAQLLALPLLLKLRHAIKAGRRGWPLIGLMLAAAFAELVPLYWLVASGTAWVFVYNSRENVEGWWFGFALFGHLASFIVFVVCSRGVMRKWMRVGLGCALLLFGSVFLLLAVILTYLPLLILPVRANVRGVDPSLGSIFWSIMLPVLIYFLLLLRREKLARQTV